MGADERTPGIDPHRQQAVAAALRAFLPAQSVLYESEDTRPYECDGLTAYRRVPMVVALPETEEQVRRVLQTCHAMDVPVVPRGAGTGLSGGALPPGDGVLLSLAKPVIMPAPTRSDTRARTCSWPGHVTRVSANSASWAFDHATVRSSSASSSHR